jgi:hypothetical protein
MNMVHGMIRSPYTPLIGILLLLLFLLGCSLPRLAPAPPQEDLDLFEMESDLVARKVLKPENPFLDFLKKRFMDFIDTFSFRISAGPGIRGHVRITKLIQAGIGYMGPAEGKTLGHTFPVYKLGYLKREGGLWQERTAEIGISLFYYYQTEGKYLGGNKRHWGPEDRGFWDIGFAGHWLLLGAEAEVRPDEIIDFFTGFFGVDYMEDDGLPPDPDILRTETGE